MKTIVISQPMFFPWIGMWEQIALADEYVHYDDVQFSKGSFTNRVQIKTAQGVQWLSVPLQNVKLGQNINQVEVSTRENWQRKHLDTLKQAYSRAPFRDEMLQVAQNAFDAGGQTIGDVAVASLESVCKYLQIENGAWKFSSQMPIDGASSRRVLDVCKYLGATRYVTGWGAAKYLAHELFEREGVTVEYMDYRKLPYSQLHGEWSPYVSVLDAIAMCGPQIRALLEPQTLNWRDFLAQRAES